MSSTTYKISFLNQDKLYEIYAKSICHEPEVYGFIAVSDLILNCGNELLVDPAAERIKAEFENVKKTYIPLQAIFRIDEVAKEGMNKIKDISKGAVDNIKQFPTLNPLDKK